MKNKHTILWGALALSAGLTGVALAGANGGEKEAALPAAAIVKALNAATSAKAGAVSGVEVEAENGAVMVDVEIVAADGKSYEVGVDSKTGKVVSVEADNENEADEKGEAHDKD